MLVLWSEYIVAWPPRQGHWLLILTKNNSVAILTAARITEHNGPYPKIMLIQDKQQEAAVDSALLGSQTNHGLTSHNGNFSTLCIHRTLIIPAGWPDQRSGWFIGCLSVCIVWIAVLLRLSFDRRAGVVCCRETLVFTYWMPGKVIPEGAPVFISVAVKHLPALTAMQELLKGTAQCAACSCGHVPMGLLAGLPVGGSV